MMPAIRRVLVLASLLGASPAGALDPVTVAESERPYGHPMLRYLKSSRPISDAHARCLRYIESNLDMQLAQILSLGSALNFPRRREFQRNLTDVIRADYAEPPASELAQLLEDAKAAVEQARAQREAEDRSLAELTGGTYPSRDDVVRIARSGDPRENQRLWTIVSQLRVVETSELHYHLMLNYRKSFECQLANARAK